MFCSIWSRWYIHIDDCSALSIDLLMIGKPTGSPVDDQELALKQNKWGFVEVISCRKIYYFIVSVSKISALVIAKLTGNRLEWEHTCTFGQDKEASNGAATPADELNLLSDVTFKMHQLCVLVHIMALKHLHTP